MIHEQQATPPESGSGDWGSPGVSGIYEVDANPARRKAVKFFGVLRYRNHEVPCPVCGVVVNTTAISVHRAAWGVKFTCPICAHPFIYSYREA